MFQEEVTLSFIFQTIAVILVITVIGIFYVKKKAKEVKKQMMPFTDEDLQAPVSSIIQNKIAPMLARDGGAIQLLDIKNAKVFVQLQGACVGCSASGSTLKYIVEKELKAAIHPDLQIVNVPHGIEDKLEEL